MRLLQLFRSRSDLAARALADQLDGGPANDAERSGTTPSELRALAAELASRCAEVKELNRRVISTTERNVLAAGESLARMVSLGQTQRADLDALGAHFDQAKGDALAAVLGRVIQFLDEMPATFSAIRADVDQLAGEAERARGRATEILDLVARIEGISRTTKFLTFNTLIEVTRVGQSHKTLTVLAKEMRTLGESVAEANRIIESLGNELTRSLPEIADAGARIAVASGARSEQILGEVDRLKRAYDAGRAVVATALANSRASCERAESLYLEIVGQLQFQDRVRQDIERADRLEALIGEGLGRLLEAALDDGPDLRARIVAIARDTAAKLAEAARLTPDTGPTNEAGRADSSGEILFL
jgi:methyl-accepting chemotaxis protein